MLSWIMLLAVVAFVASTGFKMFPHYFDYMSMDKIIQSVKPTKRLRFAASGSSIVMSARGCRSTASRISI